MFLMPHQLRRQWQRLTHCPGQTTMNAATIWCRIKWHPEGTPHQHDDITWDWGKPPFED